MLSNERHPLSTPVQYIKGVGPALAEKLKRLGVMTVADLFYLIPHRYVDRRHILPLAQLSEGKEKTVTGTIVRRGISFLGRRRKRIYNVILEDESKGRVSLIWFYFKQRYMEERYPEGAKLLVSGEVVRYGKDFQFIHPEIEILSTEEDALASAKILPLYPLTEGLSQKTIRKILQTAWGKYHHEVESVFPPYFLEQHQLVPTKECLEQLHFPQITEKLEKLLEGKSPAHRTLIFDEFFFLELGLARRRQKNSVASGIRFAIDQKRHADFLSSLPFMLTPAQQKVITEIFNDMHAPRPMNRLLQGDVGSGKTVVALAAALQAIHTGYQVAIMAPTELLAEQHYQTISRYLTPLQLPHRLLTSSLKGKERDVTLAGLQNGEIPFVVGTHALIQEDIHFQKLGFVIIDEQHRFGVLQRQAIRHKASMCDMLVMTATPIPRTLAMTLYGDLDVSVIDELPHGRKSILTKLYSEPKREKLYEGMLHELRLGRQVYVIYPLIEESEKIDLKNATDMSEEIRARFAPQYATALLHGRMKAEMKEEIMHQFRAGKIHILVSTSVVEVGVDVPNASVMVIEHAERFGLSQLHQLRGRVGRSEHQSYCILMADYRQSEEAKRRLHVMTETTDGFKIAEEDLAIRGPGEFIGTKQSGIPPFRVANLARDVALLSEARAAAFTLMQEDPELSLEKHRKLRETLLSRWAGKLELAQVS